MRSRSRVKLFVLTIAGLLGLLSLVVPGAAASPGDEVGVERYLASIRHDPARLRAFLHDLPKGGDVHTSLSGAAATESLIGFAAQDNACINSVTFAVTPGPCGPAPTPSRIPRSGRPSAGHGRWRASSRVTASPGMTTRSTCSPGSAP